MLIASRNFPAQTGECLAISAGTNTNTNTQGLSVREAEARPGQVLEIRREIEETCLLFGVYYLLNNITNGGVKTDKNLKKKSLQ